MHHEKRTNFPYEVLRLRMAAWPTAHNRRLSSLEELGSALGVSGSLGKYTSDLVSRMVGEKTVGGFNITSIKGHLSKASLSLLPVI